MNAVNCGSPILGSPAWWKRRRRRSAEWELPPTWRPEQLLEGITSQRSDIYAVGLILFEMFTGERMHGARDARDIAAWHQSGGSTQLGAQMLAGLDPGLANHILACTAPDPGGRPESAGAVLSTLEKLAPAVASPHQQAEAESSPEVLPPETIVGSDVFIAYATVDDKTADRWKARLDRAVSRPPASASRTTLRRGREDLARHRRKDRRLQRTVARIPTLCQDHGLGRIAAVHQNAHLYSRGRGSSGTAPSAAATFAFPTRPGSSR